MSTTFDYEFAEMSCKCRGCGRLDNYEARNPRCYVEVTTLMCELCFEQDYHLEYGRYEEQAI